MSRWRRIVLAAVLGAMSLPACEKPDPAVVHSDKGDQLLSKGEFKKAAEEYRLSLEINPDQTKIWEKKAFVHMKAGDKDMAAESLIKTLPPTADPKKKAELYRTVAELYRETGPVEKTEKYFLEALAADPDDLDSLGWLGEIASTQGGARSMQAGAVPAYLDKAIRYYDQAIAKNPDAILPYVNKRIALFKYQHYEQLEVKAAMQEVEDHRKNPAKAAEAKARAAQHQARLADFQRQADAVSVQITALQKKNPPKPKDAGS